MNRRTIPNIGFGLVLLVLLVTTWLGIRTANQFADNDKAVSHTYEVLAQINEGSWRSRMLKRRPGLRHHGGAKNVTSSPIEARWRAFLRFRQDSRR